jgi:hypothetical protein
VDSAVWVNDDATSVRANAQEPLYRSPWRRSSTTAATAHNMINIGVYKVQWFQRRPSHTQSAQVMEEMQMVLAV